MDFGALIDFFGRGGVVIWAIAALSIAATAVFLWKLWSFAGAGMWSRAGEAAVACWRQGDQAGAASAAADLGDPVGQVVATAITARLDPMLDDAQAREETERVARGLLGRAQAGFRVLDLTVTVAPLLGLLGTVLGMIDAFQALQAEGARADAAALAGGIWEALLTTAAGMAVAIPASVALTWLESVVDDTRARMEDAATRIFTTGRVR